MRYPRAKRSAALGASPRFFPTVARPSEAVRVGDESITFIQKRVADPFYRPRGDPFPCVPCVPWFKDEKPAIAPARWREALLIQSKPKRSVLPGLG
jgi:hypothetical protein